VHVYMHMHMRLAQDARNGKKIGYTSRFVRVILAQGPC